MSSYSSSAYASYSFPIVLLLIPIHLPVLIFLFLHRGSQVWKTGCSLELTYLLILGFWFVSTWKLACSLDASISCAVNSAISSLAYFVVIVVYMQRALKVLFRFEIQAAIDSFRHLAKEQQTIEALETGRGGWYFRHVKLVRNKYSFGYFFVAFVIFGVVNLIVALTQELVCSDFNVLDYVNWVFDIFVSIFAVIVAYKMSRHPNDAFGIKRDLKWAGAFSIVLTVLSIGGHSAVDTKTADDENFFNAMVTVVTMLFLVSLSGYKQMYFLHKLDKELEEPDYASLESLLKMDSGYESYLNYLKTEFSAENLLFWQAVEDFRRKHATSSDFNAAFVDCEQIIINYVRYGSPMELNIDTFLREELLKSHYQLREVYLANLERKETSSKMSATKLSTVNDEGVVIEVSAESAALMTMFDHAQTVVFDLMKRDPFRRFLASSLYEEFKEKNNDGRRDRPSTHSSGLKGMVETVKKLSFLGPKTNLIRISRNASEGNDNADRNSAGETPQNPSTPRGSSFMSSSSFAFATNVNTNSGTSSGHYNSPKHARASSYVSPFASSGGGGLRSDLKVTIPLATNATPRSDTYVSPFSSSTSNSSPLSSPNTTNTLASTDELTTGLSPRSSTKAPSDPPASLNNTSSTQKVESDTFTAA